MGFRSVWAYVAPLLVATSSLASAACSSNLVIDNFSSWSSNTNTLGDWTSDDGSMTTISASGGTLSFKPKSGSYFYETFPCQQATSNGYSAVQFNIKGNSGGSIVLELQTRSSCSSTSYTSYYHVVSGLTGSLQTVTVPLSSWSGANGNAVAAIVWSGFSSTSTTWQLSNVGLVCSGGSGSSSAAGSSSVPATSSSTRVSSSSAVASSSSTRVSSSSAVPTTSGTCSSSYVLDDFVSQSRLTFLYYNAHLNPTSDDGTFSSLVVASNRLTLNPASTSSYFYSKTNCLNVSPYGGISLRIKAAAGTTFSLEISSPNSCSDGEDSQFSRKTTAQLGWTFDGTEKLYSVPFSTFTGVDKTKINTIFFTGFNKPATFGPISFYCGTTVSEYVYTPPSVSADPTATVAAPSSTASAIVIDTFGSQSVNNLGGWHGSDDGLTTSWGSNRVTLSSTGAGLAFYTTFSGACYDLRAHSGAYIHIVYSGSNKFTVALQQHNSACNSAIAPFPETWDSVEASRYATATDIYIPVNHFNINLQRTIGLAFKGFYTGATTTISRVEIVKTVPSSSKIPTKLPSGNLVFTCKRPNSFAFAIDDGIPEYAQEVMQIIREENIKVTFFTVGAPLRDQSTNLSNVYKEMMAEGHQVALHSYTHPPMEGLPDYNAIDWEYKEDIDAVAETLNGLHTPYFRPPFGIEGARMRQRLTRAVGNDNAYLVMWSVDVEDWLWAMTSTPEKQLEAFQRDVNKGGNLVVLHYLYPSTVSYLRQFIQIAKSTGKQLMRVDQCMEDPNAPPL